MTGYDSVNRNVSSRARKDARDGADVTSVGRVVQLDLEEADETVIVAARFVWNDNLRMMRRPRR